jgi:hypothetical protein
MNFDFQKEMQTVINKFRKENFKVTQDALAATGLQVAKIMADNTPVGMGTGLMKKSWDFIQYPNRMYVYNSRGAKGFNLGIPLSNVAEYSQRGTQAFIGRTFESNKEKIFEVFNKEFQKRI